MLACNKWKNKYFYFIHNEFFFHLGASLKKKIDMTL